MRPSLQSQLVRLDHDTERTEVRELASGIDALYLSGRGVLPAQVFETLDAGRREAEQADGPVPFDIGGVEFMIEPRAFGMYRFCLSHRNGWIGVTPSTSLPTLRVQPRSELLHGVGPHGALAFFDAIGSALLNGPVAWSLSRLDLFCDVQGWTLNGEHRHCFVGRATRQDLHEQSMTLTGMEFGRRTTKTVCARIYDKTLQVKDKGLDWWPEVWGDRYDRSTQVLRVEFEIGRVGLKEFDVLTPDAGIERAGALWRSVTSSWLTYRTPTADATRARWPIAPEWVAVQDATIGQGALGIARIRAGRRQGDLRRITPALVGYLARAGALMGCDDLGSTLAAVRVVVERDEIRRGVPFEDRIAACVAEEALR